MMGFWVRKILKDDLSKMRLQDEFGVVLMCI